MLLTHYYGLIFIGILVLHRILHLRAHASGRRAFALSTAIIVLSVLPWYLYAMGQIRADANLASFDPGHAYQLMATLYTFSASTHLSRYSEPVLLIAALYFAGLVLNYRHNRRATSLPALGCLLPPIIVTALSLPFLPFHVNMLSERHLVIFSSVVFAGYGISLAAIIRHRRLRMFGIAAAAALLTLNAVLYFQLRDATYYRDEFRSMMSAVAALAAPEDIIAFTSGGRGPLVYYYLDRAGYAGDKNRFARPWKVHSLPQRDDDLPDAMQTFFSNLGRFWLIEIEAHLDQPPGARLEWINEHFQRVFHIPVGWHNGISLYSQAEDEPMPTSDAVIPPVIREARPGDFVRMGAPAGKRIDLFHQGQVIESRLSETWMLHQFHISDHFLNGEYALCLEDSCYYFSISHSRELAAEA